MTDDIDRYASLPDSMPAEEVADLFIELLDEVERDNTADRMRVVEALGELSERQWHTYTELAPSIRKRVESWIICNWDIESLPFVEIVTSIVPRLGLVQCVYLFRETLKKSLNPKVREVLEESLAEYGDSIADPFSGMHSGEKKERGQSNNL